MRLGSRLGFLFLIRLRQPDLLVVEVVPTSTEHLLLTAAGS